MRIVLGIGNPGGEYLGTRHNVGFLVVEELARRAGAAFNREKRFQAQAARIGETLLIKPQTYVNLSGESAQAAMAFHKVPPADLLVVVDDLNLALGTLRIREGGSSGGHNGLKDIARRIGEDFPRLRLGIGAAGPGEAIDHVLGRFRPEEMDDLALMVAKAAEAVQAWLADGVPAAMRFNGPLRPPPARHAGQGAPAVPS